MSLSEEIQLQNTVLSELAQDMCEFNQDFAANLENW